MLEYVLIIALVVIAVVGVVLGVRSYLKNKDLANQLTRWRITLPHKLSLQNFDLKRFRAGLTRPALKIFFGASLCS